MSSVNSGVTAGPNFTKFSYEIEASFALLMSTLRYRYPIPFLNARATKVGSLPFFHNIGCHSNVPRDIGKRGPDRSSAPKTLSFREKTAKIGPVDPEIIVLQGIIK